MDNNQQGQKSRPQISNVTIKKPSIVRDVVSYAIKEEIEPRSKELMRNLVTGAINMLCDTANKGVDRFIYPDGNAPKRTLKSSNGVGDYHPHTNYSTTVYKSDSKPQKESINSRSSIDVNLIWVDTEEDAKAIVGALIEEIENYGKAKVSTLYDMVKIPTNFTDFKFGWTEREESAIGYYRDRGKFFIDLPKPVNIENVN